MVPKGLRTWFVVHFIIDIAIGVPLLLAPVYTLSLFGWTEAEPVLTRLVGAALMGIGCESYLGRHASRDVYHAMLNLKLIWSASAVFSLILSLISGAPAVVWLFLGLFAGFFVVWAYYKRQLGTRE